MKDVVLKAERRDVIGKQVRALRRAGVLPAVVYGHNFDPIPISLDMREASYILPRASSSQLIGIDLTGKHHTVLVRETQRHPVTGALLHVDFQAVSLTEKLRVMVSIELKGEAPAMKLYNGVLVTGQEELEVECLPMDLPTRIEVDLSELKEIGDGIYIRDIVLPAAVHVLSPADEMSVLVTAPAVEVELEAEAEAVAAEPEVIERGKKEEEF